MLMTVSTCQRCPYRRRSCDGGMMHDAARKVQEGILAPAREDSRGSNEAGGTRPTSADLGRCAEDAAD